MGQQSIQEINEGMNRAVAAIGKFGTSVREAAASIERATRDLRRLHCLEVIAPAWLEAHPGRKLPGGNSNRRLRKKRQDYLWRWWFEQ